MKMQAHRLPEDFVLTDDRRAYAVKYRLKDPDEVFLDFYQYWRSKAKDNTKLDWDMAWQMWVRKDSKYNPPKEIPLPVQPMKVATRVIPKAEVLSLPEPDQKKVKQLLEAMRGSLKTLQ